MDSCQTAFQGRIRVMGLYGMKTCKTLAVLAVKAISAALLILSLGSCAGGSLMNPTPMIGRDRLVYRILDQAVNTTYYTRNVWYDGDNYRFHDVYGREISILKSDQVAIEIIGAAEYYETPE
jgi:hypothetical protein